MATNTAMRAALFVLFTVLYPTGWTVQSAHAQAEQSRVMRLAELEIDPSQLERYKAALQEEIKASIALEPGVLTLYAVSLKDDPVQIRLFEVYASPAAYQSHLQTPHFKKYKMETQGMIRSLKLREAEPVLLGSRPVSN